MVSHLLEILGRGLIAELQAAFRQVLADDADRKTESLKSAAQAQPPDADALIALGVRMLHEQQYGAARDAFCEASKADRDSTRAYLGLACALDELGLIRAAAESLREAQLRTPTDPAVLFALGFCLEKVGETDEAIDAYESAIDINSDLRNAHERLAAIYLRRDDLQLAITHYEHLCYCEPDNVAASLALAGLYLRTEQFDDAIRRFEYAIAIDPENWEAQDDLVTAYVEAGRLDDAVDRLVTLIDRDPHCVENHVRLGDLLRDMGQDRAAADAFAHAVKLNPDHLEASIKLGAVNLRKGDYGQAMKAFTHATELNDRVLSAYVGIGVAQQALGKTGEALETFEMAAGIEPNSTLLFAETARLQLLANAAAQSKRYLEPEEIAQRPEETLSDDVADLIDTQIASLRRAIRSHPTHADLHYRLGLLLRHRGDLAGAVQAFQAAVNINPSYAKAQAKLGLALRALGRDEEAIKSLRSALTLDCETIDLHYQLGLIFADRGEFNLAVQSFEDAVNARPDKCDYVANLALALQNMGLLDRAAATWQVLNEICQTAPEGRALATDIRRVAGRP